MGALVKFLLVVMGIGSVAASTYFLEQVVRSDRSFQVAHSPDDDPPAGGHAAAEESEGESPRKPATAPSAPGAPVIVSLEQTFANVLDAESHAHSLMLKLDVELFDESTRLLVDQRDGVLKSAIIETARQQSYE